MRIGIGYDIHRLVTGEKLIIGGVEIPFEKGLLGHSDADVLAHAIIDSLLGAAALGDIGAIFPDTDEKYKNADSLALLENVCGMIREHGYEIVNIDTNVIIQAPKMKPYIAQMRVNIANAAGIDVEFVSVKAKTNEELDSVGLGNGVIAQAVCIISNITDAN